MSEYNLSRDEIVKAIMEYSGITKEQAESSYDSMIEFMQDSCSVEDVEIIFNEMNRNI